MIVKRFKCIKINDERENKYLISAKYKDLVDITEVNKLSINRLIDEDRAKRMIDFIKMDSNFYPTIIMVTSEDCNLTFYESTSELELRSESNYLLGVVDGQHRYRSIELMLENEEITEEAKQKIMEREQSIFLISNLKKREQRTLFLEINRSANKVKKATELRLDISVYNYYGLEFLKNHKEFLEYINFDEDQVLKKEEKKIPYKYIIKSNEALLKDFEQEYKNKNVKAEELNKYYECIEYIWDTIMKKVVEYIKQDKPLRKSIFSLEIFYTTFFDMIYRSCKSEPESFSNESIKEEFNKMSKILEVDTANLKNDVDAKSGNGDKVRKIKEKIEDIIGEN